MKFPYVLALLSASAALINPFSANAQAAETLRSVTPFHSYDFSNIDTVELSHGGIILNIPIVSYKQLGSLPPLTIKLNYSGRQWQFTKERGELIAACGDENSPSCYNYRYTFETDRNRTGVQVVAEPELRGRSTFGYSNESDPTNSQVNGLRVDDSLGGSHLLAPLADGSGFVSMDASGITYSGTGYLGTIIDRDGIKFEQWCQSNISFGSDYCYAKSISDPVGNRITANADPGSQNNVASWTDSINRTIPAPPRPDDNTSNVGPLGCTTINYPGASDNGGIYPVGYCWHKYLATTNFPLIPNIDEAQGGTYFNALSSITLPDGRSWFFTYNSWGELESMTTPLGAVFQYVWMTKGHIGCAGDPSSQYNLYDRAVQQRTISPADQANSTYTWTYDYSNGVSEHLPDGNTIHHQFGFDCGTRETQTEYIDKDSGTQKTVNYEYTSIGTNTYAPADGDYGLMGVTLKKLTTMLPDGSTSQVCNIYDANADTDCTGSDSFIPSTTQATGYSYGPLPTPSYPVIRGSLLFRSESGWGAGNPGTTLKITRTNYIWQQPSSPYLGAGLLGLIDSQVVSDNSGAVYSQISYKYDEADGYSPAGTIGNMTSSTRQAGNGSAPVTNHVAYNATSMPIRNKDARGVVSTIDYQCGGLLPQNVTEAAEVPATLTALRLTYQYDHDCNLSSLTSVRDPNDLASGRQGTHATLNVMGDISSISYPDGGLLSVDYANYALPLTVTSTHSASPDPSVITKSEYDGLKRVGLSTVGDVSTQHVYGYDGRTLAASNPYTVGNSALVTTYSYDVLGRPVTTTQTDQSTLNWTYNGPFVRYADEASQGWTRGFDPLGRLISVLENSLPFGTTCSGSCGYPTSYNYDPLGNLTNVSQVGDGTVSSLTREFHYDQLSRLVTSRNPETGTVCYGLWTGSQGSPANCKNGYDPNGNLVYKTDAGSVQTSYSYDALDRLVFKTAPNLNISYTYDAVQSGSGGDQTNLVGRLAFSTNNLNADLHFGYDSLGRQTYQAGCTYSSCTATSNPVHAVYDLAGNMTSLTYPDGRNLRQTWDNSGRLSASNLTYTDGTIQGLFNAVAYWPNGSPSLFTVGNGVQQCIGQNNRMQVSSIVVVAPQSASQAPCPTTAGYLAHTYCYSSCITGGPTSNNGNLLQIADTLNSANTQDFGYDRLNRLRDFSLGSAAYQHFNIDPLGNMNPTLNVQYSPHFGADNRISDLPCAASTLAYDAAGNQRCDTDGNGGVTERVFDAENRIVQISALNSEASPSVQYVYGPDGTRERKILALGDWTEYVTFGGKVISELNPTTGWTDYAYANGNRIANITSTDHRLHLSGNTIQPGANLAVNIAVPPIIFKTGDRICWQQYNRGAWTGIAVQYQNGYAWTAGQVLADDGQQGYEDRIDGGWQNRCMRLDSIAGETFHSAIVMKGDVSPAGSWDSLFADLAIIRSDGSVIQIFGSGDNPGLVVQAVDPGRDSSFTAVTEDVPAVSDQIVPVGSSYPRLTHYFVADHLGSSSMEFSAAGWPVAVSHFAPYGAEINPQTTANHYKFTGKERDTESGLDYFGARYYASSMGRWMSPDWADKPEAVPYSDLANPQSLNLYGYVNNNPLSHADKDGHEQDPLDPKQMASMAKDIQTVKDFVHNHPVVSSFLAQAAFAVITDGMSGEAGAMPKLTEAPAPVSTPAPSEGIYEFPDAKAPGKTYVGQSGDVPSRLDQHVQSGKMAEGTEAKTTSVPGGKTAREVAETNRIKQLGGKSSEPGSQTSNQRNPVSDKRMEKIKNGSQQ